MTWAQIITLVRRRLQEDTEAFYEDYILKQYAVDCQREMAFRIPELFPIKRTFSSVAAQAEYPFRTYAGPDLMGITRVAFDTVESLGHFNDNLQSVISSTGTPSAWAIRQNNLILYPTPTTADKTITVFGYRTPPRYAINLYHDGTTGTAATYAVSNSTLTLSITGGDTDTFDLTDADYDTLGELCTAINALGNGWTATKPADTFTNEDSDLLEDISATTAYQTTANLYENPEGPEYTQQYLIHGILYKAFQEDLELENAEVHLRDWTQALIEIDKLSTRRAKGFSHKSIRNVYGHGYTSPTADQNGNLYYPVR